MITLLSKIGTNSHSTTVTPGGTEHAYLPPIQQQDGGTLHIPHGYPYGHQWREFVQSSASSSAAAISPNENSNGGALFTSSPWHNGWGSTIRPPPLLHHQQQHQQRQENNSSERSSPISVTAQSPTTSSVASPQIPEGIMLFSFREL